MKKAEDTLQQKFRAVYEAVTPNMSEAQARVQRQLSRRLFGLTPSQVLSSMVVVTMIGAGVYFGPKMFESLQRNASLIGDPPADTIDDFVSPIPSSEEEPQVTLRPRSGPVGTRIKIEGTGFGSEYWRSLVGESGGYGAALQQMVGQCDLIGAGEGLGPEIDGSGRLIAELVVPAEGTCFQEDGRKQDFGAGVYDLIIGCHTCAMAEFVVTNTDVGQGEGTICRAQDLQLRASWEGAGGWAAGVWKLTNLRASSCKTRHTLPARIIDDRGEVIADNQEQASLPETLLPSGRTAILDFRWPPGYCGPVPSSMKIEVTILGSGELSHDVGAATTPRCDTDRSNNRRTLFELSNIQVD